jgi:hypothetical protein
MGTIIRVVEMYYNDEEWVRKIYDGQEYFFHKEGEAK